MDSRLSDGRNRLRPSEKSKTISKSQPSLSSDTRQLAESEDLSRELDSTGQTTLRKRIYRSPLGPYPETNVTLPFPHEDYNLTFAKKPEGRQVSSNHLQPNEQYSWTSPYLNYTVTDMSPLRISIRVSVSERSTVWCITSPENAPIDFESAQLTQKGYNIDSHASATIILSSLKPSSTYLLSCFGVSAKRSHLPNPDDSTILVQTPASHFEIVASSFSHNRLQIRLFSNLRLDGVCFLLDRARKRIGVQNFEGEKNEIDLVFYGLYRSQDVSVKCSVVDSWNHSIQATSETFIHGSGRLWKDVCGACIVLFIVLAFVRRFRYRGRHRRDQSIYDLDDVEMSLLAKDQDIDTRADTKEQEENRLIKKSSVHCPHCGHRNPSSFTVCRVCNRSMGEFDVAGLHML